ncbi:MAG: cytochrome d ubiquinol oxidase subunit II [Candidatus Aureabacteria bacterium]|nr:cytochrome d ubiquinol oxidase subunit II [Candidatus Auribacterota bacterium]
MEQSVNILATVWFYLLGLILALYIVLDGFDLGIGILSLFSNDENRRRIMMGSLGTIWDANETWLVIFGGALFGAFPLCYSLLLNALYIPVFLMAVGLIFRGVAFEFHNLAVRKRLWDWSFGMGSLLAAVSQGFILGGALGGIRTDGAGNFTGGMFDWVNSFTVLMVIGVVSGYAMLGATYLVMKTEGPIQMRNYRWAMVTAFIAVGVAAATTAAMSFIHIPVARRWTTPPALFYFIGLFLAVTSIFWLLIFSLTKRRESIPFFASIAIFLLTFAGLWASMYPSIVPDAVTVQMAAASPETLKFMLAGIGALIPIIMVYNGYMYLVFRGKVREGSEYRNE